MKPRWWSLAVVLVLSTSALAQARTWTDTQGRKMEAKFVRLHEGNVILLKGTKPVSVPLSQFSPEDQEHIRRQVENKGEAEPSPVSPALEPVEKPSPAKPPAEGVGPERTWTDIRGNRMTAAFGGVSGGSVILLEKGKRRNYPFLGFSAADQEYVRNELEARGQGHLLPGAGMPPAGEGVAAPPRPSRPFPTPHRPSPPLQPSVRRPGPVMPSIPRPSHGPTIPRPSMPSHEPPRPSMPSMPSHEPPRPSMPSYTPPPPPSPPSMPMSGPPVEFEYKKQCNHCKKIVPNSSKAGGKCPHCGVYWDYEEGPGGRTGSTAYRTGKYVGFGGLFALVAFLLGLGYRAIRS